MSTGSGGARLVPRRQQHRGRQAPFARAQQRDAGDQPGRLGVGRDDGRGCPRWTVVTAPSTSRPCRATTSVPPRSLPVCTPRSGVSRTSPSGPHVHSPTDSGASLAAKQHRLVIDVEHVPDLQGRRRHRLARDHQPPRPFAVGDGHQPPGRPCGRARRGRCRPTSGRCARGRATSRRWPGRPAARAAPSGRAAARRPAGRARPRRRRRGTPRPRRSGSAARPR